MKWLGLRQTHLNWFRLILILSLLLGGAYTLRLKSPRVGAIDNLHKAEVFRLNGAWTFALRYYQQALVEDPTSLNARMGAAESYFHKHDYINAKIQVLHVNESDPQDADAQILYGNILARENNLNGAVAAWTKAREIRPYDGTTFYQRGLYELSINHYKEAAEYFQEALKYRLNGLDLQGLHYYYALAQLGLGEDARSQLTQALQKPYNLEFFAAMQSQAWVEQAKALKGAWDMPIHDRGRLALNQGRFLLNNGQIDLARTLLSRAVEAYPIDGTARAYYGASFYFIKDPDRALAEFKRAAQDDPTNPDPLLFLGDYYLHKQDYDQAFALFTQARTNNAPEYIVHAGFAQILEHKQDYDGAAEEYKQVAIHSLLILPSDEPYNGYATLARFYYRHNLEVCTKGLQAANQAVGVMPQSSDAWDLMGSIRVSCKQYPDGLNALQQAIRLDPTNANAHLHLAEAFNFSGKKLNGDFEFALAQDLNVDAPLSKYIVASP